MLSRRLPAHCRMILHVEVLIFQENMFPRGRTANWRVDPCTYFLRAFSWHLPPCGLIKVMHDIRSPIYKNQIEVFATEYVARTGKSHQVPRTAVAKTGVLKRLIRP